MNYAQLAPGDYRFQVRAVSPEGAVSSTPATVSFTILPPLWRRPWFVAAAALLVALAGYGLYRYRVRRLLEIERVRTRIATDLHDDIGSSLSQVAILSEVVLKKVGDDPEVTSPLSRVAEVSREAVDSMSDIVWAITRAADGHGLASMKARAAALGGTLEIASPDAAGTTVVLKVPLSRRGRRARPHLNG